jgi:selenocysteine-specific elongation factor
VHVVATAGHVDHGKSTLVRALTGMEPDRWAEERRRGMTIDLGYAWTALPSGAEVAFVDVPGHQRFIANMLAGVGPVPAALFVVAADEGWQRQSTEHLAALDALGVGHGLLAVTRIDLADPAAATHEALEHIARSSLGVVPAVAVSGATGAGLDALRAALDDLVATLPPADATARVRLWVDRVFTIRGAGTVVTGTLPAGRLRVGDELELASTGGLVRVRGLESLKRRAEEVTAVARVAVNLRGVEVTDLHRGDALLTPGGWRPTGELDVRLTGTPAAELPRELVLHIGSAGVPVAVRPLAGDTARLLLRTALPVQAGDRALLRDPGQQRVAAGVLVLDAAPPRLSRRGAARERAVVLASASGTPDAAAEVRRRGWVSRAELAALGVLAADARAPDGVREVDGWLVDDATWDGWRAALSRAVDEHLAAAPLDAGLPHEAARRRVGVPDLAVLTALVAADPQIESVGGRLRRPGVHPELGPGVAELARRLADDPFAAPDGPELDRLALTPALLAAAERAGLVKRLGGGVVVGPDAVVTAATRLAGLEQPFTASAAREALGASRRVVIPLLEHLDRAGVTVRDGALRRVR